MRHKYKAFIEVRSQKVIGKFPKCSPDTYVTVQACPHGVRRLKVLNHKVAEKRGIVLIHCGEGYSKNCKTDKSTLNQALNNASRICKSINIGTPPSLHQSI